MTNDKPLKLKIGQFSQSSLQDYEQCPRRFPGKPRPLDPATTKYTGRSLKAKVIYITFGPDWSIPSGACVMSISDPYDIIQ